MCEESTDDVVVVEIAVGLCVISHHPFGGLDGCFGPPVALGMVRRRQAVAHASTFKECFCLTGGELRAAVAGQFYRDSFCAEEGAETRHEASGTG